MRQYIPFNILDWDFFSSGSLYISIIWSQRIRLLDYVNCDLYFAVLFDMSVTWSHTLCLESVHVESHFSWLRCQQVSVSNGSVFERKNRSLGSIIMGELNHLWYWERCYNGSKNNQTRLKFVYPTCIKKITRHQLSQWQWISRWNQLFLRGKNHANVPLNALIRLKDLSRHGELECAAFFRKLSQVKHKKWKLFCSHLERGEKSRWAREKDGEKES